MLLVARMTETSAVDCVDNGNEHALVRVLQEAMTMMVDCNKGTQDCATQQPTEYLCCIEEASNNRGTTISSM
jgi:hypothetical protein